MEVDEFEKKEEEKTARIKWRDFEVHHFIVIRGEMNEEFIKLQTNNASYVSVKKFKINKSLNKK